MTWAWIGAPTRAPRWRPGPPPPQAYRRHLREGVGILFHSLPRTMVVLIPIGDITQVPQHREQGASTRQVLGQPRLPPECRAAHWFVCPCWTTAQVARESLLLLQQHGGGGGVRNFTPVLEMVCVMACSDWGVLQSPVMSPPHPRLSPAHASQCTLVNSCPSLQCISMHRSASWSSLTHPVQCIPMHHSALQCTVGSCLSP